MFCYGCRNVYSLLASVTLVNTSKIGRGETGPTVNVNVDIFLAASRERNLYWSSR